MVINIERRFGGAEKSIVDIIEGVKAKSNYEILFIVENIKMQKLLDAKGIKYKSIKLGEIQFNIKGVIKVLYGNLKILKEVIFYKPDIIFSNTDLSHMLSIFISFIFKNRLVIILRDYGFRTFIKKILDFFSAKTIYVSKHLKQFYNDNSDNPVIPNGIKLENINTSTISNKYRTKKEVLYCVATRFVEWKGIDILIEAFNLVNKELDQFNGKLLIAGEPKNNSKEYDYYIKLNELVKKHGLSSKVKFIGWVDNPINFFNNCDVILSSSTSNNGGPESFGRTIIEAWSVKKPVIATNCGGPSDLVKDNINGLKVEENNIKEFKKALIDLYENKDKRELLGYNGFQSVLGKYNIDNISDDYLKFINEIGG